MSMPTSHTLPQVHLGSDTQTRPTQAMREAMAQAPVGDEQAFGDPTTRALEERVADLLGHEAGVFLPSGTMCNEIAVRLHTGGGGDEVLAEASSHLVNAEAGGPAALSGVTLTPIRGERGVFTPAQVKQAVRARSRYAPRTRLMCVEQTANAGGGTVWQTHQIDSVVAAARELGLATHLDGARLLNATVASGTSAATFASGFDTAWLDFSKGLGAPVGAVLVGSRALIDEAWRYKQMWGGAMRQSGIIAAGGLHALDHHVERLAEDHANAKALALGLAAIDGVRLDPSHVETNIVYFEVDDAPAFERELAERGVIMNAKGPHRVRAVTHLDVSSEDIATAVRAAAEAVTAVALSAPATTAGTAVPQ
ncbi:threonine aldolase family protein [Streptomyces sp. NPDC052042]|uniref:threonine aldolase family protein n=1 Tax=Streptomyces sp. NPDC052042 TaxID=3365683 RepID=UPI0037D96E87